MRGFLLNVTAKSPFWLFNEVSPPCSTVGHKFWKKLGEKKQNSRHFSICFSTFGVAWTWSSKPVVEIPYSKNTRPGSERNIWKLLSPEPPNFGYWLSKRGINIFTFIPRPVEVSTHLMCVCLNVWCTWPRIFGGSGPSVPSDEFQTVLNVLFCFATS